MSFKDLQEVFPDAESSYLEEESARFSLREDYILFILRCFAYREYPRRGSREKESEDPLNKASAEENIELLSGLSPDDDQRCTNDTPLPKNTLSENETAGMNYPMGTELMKRRLSGLGEVSLEPRFHTLTEMLPNADPEYLEQAAKKLKNNEEVSLFVLRAVEENNYPKMDAYLKRREYQNNWMKYIVRFNIKEYLIEFPDPVGYFYFEKKGSENMPSNFFLHRYGVPIQKPIRQLYKKMKYSISRTCDQLDYRMSPTYPKKYSEWDGSTQFDVTVLQEIAFIQNKEEIARYILARTRQKGLAFDQAKERGELVACLCCWHEQIQDDVVACPEGHIFCASCVRRGTEVAIGEGKTSFLCYSDNCNAEFHIDVLKSILPPDIFSRLLVKRQYEEVKAADIPGLETCPFCEFCCILDAADKVFRCLNSRCMKVSCRKCKKVEHLPLPCDEPSTSREETERGMKKFVEEKMTEALTRTCYRCDTKFIKEAGCNIIRCKCGAKMCYMCSQPIKSAYHFESGPCKLYESDEDLHVTRVMAEGRKAKWDVAAAHPGIRLTQDPTAGPSSSPD